MEKLQIKSEDKKVKVKKPEVHDQEKHFEIGPERGRALDTLQHTLGNKAVQRLLTQRKGEASYEIDEDTSSRINHERSSGQSLDEKASNSIGAAMGYDFTDVRVHTSPEASALNQELSAKAFTTGKDIFFQEGAYDPNSSSGQELLAHELTHVVQQGTGAAGGGGRMTVNAPGDSFEQEADASARSALSPATGSEVHRQANPEEEEEKVNRQEEEKKDEDIQMQELDDDEKLQKQEEGEEEPPLEEDGGMIAEEGGTESPGQMKKEEFL